MKLVMLSGGSGKRLWPLSNDARSKQFLKVLENENHELVSMVQRVWGQILTNGLADSCYIATSKSQIEIMRSQVGEDVPLIIEPERRDTFAAIMLAATFLYSHAAVGLDEVVAILPVDPFVENHFFESIKQLESVLYTSGSEIALIGVEPTYPSTKYGYIIPSKVNSRSPNGYIKVSHFQEKPTEDAAQTLITQNALWNCGVFAFRLRYVIELLERRGMPIQFEELSKQYHKLPKISFDYEVLEKSADIVVLPYNGYWKDLGTWNTLTEEMQNQKIGRGIISEDCVNTHLINEIDIPVSILGVSDIVVAASPDGILVSDKSASPRIKELVNFDQGPMYEERQWGWIRILDDHHYEDGRSVVTKRVRIHKEKNISYRMHTNREEVWTIVKGQGEFIQNGNFMIVNVGNVLHIPMKSLHSIRALSELEMIVVQSGITDEHNEVIELYNSWDEIAQHCIKV
ncbi:sugar phosphate nucleotidyltransferase [Paenibacillus ihbetae]|uniref:Mannose-1-phosphate guanylyltransferase n=1 Tax=Paenibacillus ihbetae TaxID=1870820 RepID=A0ABX3JTP5_9BACL|nr:sugar phosphate nucleotidyltransferase [Paenibacillus ihbetae]OOC59300.1 mannose-1-phosphate guanylyltransferase [Paenibacillus ihbetae]